MSDSRLSLLLRQAELAFDRQSWHGPNLMGALRGMALETAAYRPQPGAHNAWEVIVHCAYWKYRVCRLLPAERPRSFSLRGSDWFVRPTEGTDTAWREDVRLLREWHDRLRSSIESLDPALLDQPSGSGRFSVAELVSGAAAHDLYHAGQIRLLRRMHGRTEASRTARS